MVNLLTLTSIVNFLALAISLWLGFYIVTRSPRRQVSWLAALTLWSLISLFFNNLLHLNLTPEETLPLWLTSFRGTVIPAPAFWLHLTVLFLPPQASKRERPLVAAAYFAAAFFLILGGATNQLLPGVTEAGKELASSRQAGAFYPYFVGFTVVTLALALGNLTYGWLSSRGQPAAGRQLATLWAATLLGSAGASYLTVSIWQGFPIPTLPGELSLGAGVSLLGYAVARYDALVEGRVMRSDFLYSFFSAALVTTFFLLFTSALYFHYHLPFAIIILVTVLAIISHSLYDGVRSFLDRLFYTRRYQTLRANLRILAREAGTSRDLPEQLQPILTTLCRSLESSRGAIGLKLEEGFRVEAAIPANLRGVIIPLDSLPGEDTTLLEADTSLLGMALYVPLYWAGERVGVLLLGPRSQGSRYTPEDLEMLEDMADQMAALIRDRRLQEESIQHLDLLVSDLRRWESDLERRAQALSSPRGQERLAIAEEEEFISLVEDALRHLADYSYLGEHKLAQSRVVDLTLKGEGQRFATHLDRGKALNNVLLLALEKLRPQGEQAHPPGQEWYPYLVLYNAYVLGKLNRDIMGELYISEGTFNRLRRRAVRGVARAISEMEEAGEGL